MNKIFTAIMLFLACSGIFAQGAGSPEQLFKQYLVLGDNFDPKVAALYSDNAKIFTFRRYPHGLERQMELTGKQWKELLVRVMPAAKAANDISTYKNVKITEHGKGYKIKTDRYSKRKCYTDTGHYIIVEPDDSGNLLIVEEYSETQSQSNC